MTATGAADRAARIIRAGAHGRCETGMPLGPLTSYQLGGPAAVYIEAEGDADLAALGDALDETGLPLLIVGRGSNMLVSDAGFDGIAVRLGGGYRWARVEGAAVHAGGAMPVPALASLAAGAALAGFEFAAAIPASFGGAIAMNAGAHHRSVSEVVTEARVYDLTRRAARTVAAADLGFTYRTSALPLASIVTAGVAALAPGDPGAIAAGMREAREWRRATQPVGLPNAGSVFKNPPEEAAGSLVERICGKGTRSGGARISEVHANFIVTEPGATAADVHSLIRRIQREVLDNAGVRLETEVKLIGRFGETE
ncbi:MAG TPA: UDP-N-acetylmuramate dehydrogenase [Actinomycetota bacterium]